jgi:curli biogenesis system outer membrane secretion channel CsgG
MLRQLSRATGMLALAAAFALPAAALAQADHRPVVVVFRFENSSIGTGKADFDGLATGIQDLLITDLASNDKIRLVDRTHLNDVLTEQNLGKDGRVDPTTAARIGKILGAQYAVTGGFLSDGKGSAVMTGRTIDIETTQIINPQKISGKTDNLLGMIADLSSKVSSNMNLAPKPGAAVSKPGASQSASPASSPAAKAAVATENYAKPAKNPEAVKATKLDMATMKIYSNALDEIDRKNNVKAETLLKQVVAKYPAFEPAQRNLDALQGKASH